jgi:hypothetical protein
MTVHLMREVGRVLEQTPLQVFALADIDPRPRFENAVHTPDVGDGRSDVRRRKGNCMSPVERHTDPSQGAQFVPVTDVSADSPLQAAMLSTQEAWISLASSAGILL